MDLVRSAALLLVLLNPFLIVIYLIDVVQKLNPAEFARVVLRAGFISITVFCCFAVLGDAVFAHLMQAQFASFQIFGGVVFFLIALQFVFRGPKAIEMLQGESQHLSGAIAMPVLIGPGTIGASVVIGKRLEPMAACIVIMVSVTLCLLAIILLKILHDRVRARHEPLIERYIEIVGRVMALVVGTIAVEMVMRGLSTWGEAA